MRGSSPGAQPHNIGVYMHSSIDLSEDTEKRKAIADEPVPAEEHATSTVSPAITAAGQRQWFAALRQVFPIFLATHLAFLILTYCSALFTLGNFSYRSLGLNTLLNALFRWDSGHFTAIATNGYDTAWRTAFFPTFPLLEHLVSFLTHDPFVAGLIISNGAGLLMLAVLYRLVQED